MKKVVIILILTTLLLSGIIFWILKPDVPIETGHVVQFGIILIFILFALKLAFTRLMSLKQGLPAEDELSKKLMKLLAAS